MTENKNGFRTGCGIGCGIIAAFVAFVVAVPVTCCVLWSSFDRTVRERVESAEPDAGRLSIGEGLDQATIHGEGLDQATIHAVFERERAGLARCWRDVPAEGVTFELTLVIDPSGRVRNAAVSGDGIEPHARCVERMVRGWRFPRAQAATNAAISVRLVGDPAPR
jgi:hypothetical protein